MPFVNAKITMPVNEAQKDLLQAGLTDFVAAVLGKPKKFVMVNIEAAQDIWFAGEKLERGAFVSVRLMGNATKAAYSLAATWQSARKILTLSLLIGIGKLTLTDCAGL